MKAYLPYIIIVLMLSLLSGAYWSGRYTKQMEYERTALKNQLKQKDVLKTIEVRKVKREVRYVEKIKIIKAAPDPSGCLDVRMPDSILLQLPGGSAYRSGVNRESQATIVKRADIP